MCNICLKIKIVILCLSFTSCVTKFAVVNCNTKIDNVKVSYATNHSSRNTQVVSSTGETFNLKSKGFIFIPRKENVYFEFTKDGYEKGNRSPVLTFYNSRSKARANSTVLPINDMKIKQYFHIFSIKSTPSGAYVYMNGKEVGSTPMNDFPYTYDLIDNHKDTLSLRLSLSDYKTWEDKIILSPKYETPTNAKRNVYEKSVELSPEKFFSTINVTSEPEGAKVYFDEEFIGETPIKSWIYPFTTEAQYEKKKIVIQHDDYVSETKFVDLKPNFSKKNESIKNPENISVRLVPKVYYYAYRILSNPDGASISLSQTSEYIGNTPTEIQLGTISEKRLLMLSFLLNYRDIIQRSKNYQF